MKLVLVTLLAVFLTTSAGQRCRTHTPPPLPTSIVELQYEATPAHCCQKCPRKCYDELILPPLRAEIPRGLGYFPAAVPLVSSYFNPAIEVCGICSGASIPVTSPCSGVTLAAPICPDLAPLVRPIIL